MAGRRSTPPLSPNLSLLAPSKPSWQPSTETSQATPRDVNQLKQSYFLFLPSPTFPSDRRQQSGSERQVKARCTCALYLPLAVFARSSTWHKLLPCWCCLAESRLACGLTLWMWLSIKATRGGILSVASGNQSFEAVGVIISYCKEKLTSESSINGLDDAWHEYAAKVFIISCIQWEYFSKKRIRWRGNSLSDRTLTWPL